MHNPVDEDIREQIEDQGDKIDIVLKKGEAIIMNQKLPHGSMPNLQDDRRIAAGLHLIPNEAESIMCFKEKDDTLSVYEILDDDFYINGFDGDDSKSSKHLKFNTHNLNSWKIIASKEMNEVNPN